MHKKGVALLRERNEKQILTWLRRNKQSTRQELAKILGVSKNTVSLIIDKFITDGVIRETGLADPSGVGRPRIQLMINGEIFKFIGFLIQETRGQYAVIDYSGSVLESASFQLNTEKAEECLGELTRLSSRLLDRHPEVRGIGMAVPGLVDPKAGVVHYAARLGWKNVCIKEKLSTTISVPASILNSVKAAALKTIDDLQEKASESVFYIRIDDGVGGAVLIGNSVYVGSSWTAGEIGHVSVNPDGPLCTCGKKGCLEQFVSVPVITKFQGDEYLEKIVQAGYYLGLAVGHVINLLNPGLIVIDSPYGHVLAFQHATRQSIKEQSLCFPYERTEIIFINDLVSPAIGAATAVLHDFEQAKLSWHA